MQRKLDASASKDTVQKSRSRFLIVSEATVHPTSSMSSMQWLMFLAVPV